MIRPIKESMSVKNDKKLYLQFEKSRIQLDKGTIVSNIRKLYNLSPGLVVQGGDSRLRGSGFNPSTRYWKDIFTIIVMFVKR